MQKSLLHFYGTCDNLRDNLRDSLRKKMQACVLTMSLFLVAGFATVPNVSAQTAPPLPPSHFALLRPALSHDEPIETPQPVAPKKHIQAAAPKIPVPPVRPKKFAPASPPQTAKPAATDLPAPLPPLSQDDAIAHANAYFNAITTMQTDFVQVGGDGHRVTGKLYLSKPGKVLFDYDPPSTLQIIADGFSVAVRDRKLNTQDIYLIAQTPLKFLLSAHVDLAKDTRILDVVIGEEIVQILAEDRFTLGGSSRIELLFDRADFTLRQWIIDDPQGFQTVVTLGAIDTTTMPNPNLFRITNGQKIEGK